MSSIPIKKTVPPFRTTRADMQKHFDEFVRFYPLFVDAGETFGPEISNMIEQTFDGLKEGLHPPTLAPKGIGGTYILYDTSGVPVSVFKPLNEEASSALNPKGYDFEISPRDSIQAGGGAAREIAAYYLDCRRMGLTGDQIFGFSGVPPTVLAHCLHKKFKYPKKDAILKDYMTGSLQMYMKHDGHFGEETDKETDKEKQKEKEREEVLKRLSMENVHRISVLDIRLVNTDRHGGNILYKKNPDGTVDLIPIDHGYCFPKTFDDCCVFKWRDWPEAKEPYSETVKKYIESSLNLDEDIKYLKKFHFTIPDKCIQVLNNSTELLKKGAKRGLSPFQIGSLLCEEAEENPQPSAIKKIVDSAEAHRLPGPSESVVSQTMESQPEKIPLPSPMKKIVDEAKKKRLPDTSEDEFLEIVYEMIDTRLDKIPLPTSTI